MTFTHENFVKSLYEVVNTNRHTEAMKILYEVAKAEAGLCMRKRSIRSF